MLILIMFLGAQALLAYAVWTALQIAFRQPDLAGRLSAITEIRHKRTRLDAARKEIVWVGGEVDVVVEQLDRARRRLDEFVPLPEPPASIVLFGVLTGILYEGESGVALLLNLASRFANMSDAVAAFVSPIVAAALFAALHVILGALIHIGADHRPQRVLHRAKLGAVIGGTGVILAGWMVLSGRSFTDAQMIETIASWGLLTLALLLSVAGAFASLVVTTLNDERAIERRTGRLQKYKTFLERHLEAVQRDIDQHGDRPATITALSTVASVGAVLAIVITPFLHPATAHAQAGGIRQAEATTVVKGVAGVMSAVTPRSCETLIDVSLSVEAMSRKKAVEQIGADLETLANAFGCEILRFSAFSGDPPFNVLREAGALHFVAPLKSCEDAAGTNSGGTAVNEAVRTLYPSVRAAQKDDAVRNCVSKDRQRYESDIRTRQQALDDARAIWREVARTESRGSCTALELAVRRAVGRSQHVLVLSDGANTCDTALIKSGSRNAVSGETLTFLLLPAAGRDADARGLRNLVRLQIVYPSSHVLFFSELTPSMWRLLKPSG